MGFNFRAGNAVDVYGDKHNQLLISRFGPSLPLGEPGKCFTLNDELAWSWWSELQAFAAAELGEDASIQILAVDAWEGVYIDADVHRELLGTATPGTAEPGMAVVVTKKQPTVSRLLGSLGLRKAAASEKDVQDAARAAMKQMVRQYGARPGEAGALQVGNLRGLISELTALLKKLNIEPAPRAIASVLKSYRESDARCDQDGHIQCLCHAWFTAGYALRTRSPLWLVK